MVRAINWTAVGRTTRKLAVLATVDGRPSTCLQHDARKFSRRAGQSATADARCLSLSCELQAQRGMVTEEK